MEGFAILIIIISSAVFKGLIKRWLKPLKGETKLKIFFGFFLVVLSVPSLISICQQGSWSSLPWDGLEMVLNIGFWCLIYLAIKKNFSVKIARRPRMLRFGRWAEL